MTFLAKSIELDERIPFIPRLKRKCELKESQGQIKNAEVKILEACNWNPLYTTVLEVLEFYLTQGVLFSSDQFHDEKANGNQKSLPATSVSEDLVLKEQDGNVQEKLGKANPTEKD